MNSNNPNDDEILKAAMGDLDDAFGNSFITKFCTAGNT